jgi:putative flippase GtrA
MRREWGRMARFVVNGLVAAGVHFATLYFMLEMAGLRSAGLANLLAAGPGLSASFLGNRYFVFRAGTAPWGSQAARFVGLYAMTALVHGAVLLCWTDLAGLDYRVGFLLATALQVVLSYLGNRMLVFRP